MFKSSRYMFIKIVLHDFIIEDCSTLFKVTNYVYNIIFSYDLIMQFNDTKLMNIIYLHESKS